MLTLSLVMSHRSQGLQRTSQMAAGRSGAASGGEASHSPHRGLEGVVEHAERNFYNNLFLGQVDLVISSGFAAHMKCRRAARNKPMSRSAFVAALQNHLVGMTGANVSYFAEPSRPGTPLPETRWRNAQHAPNITEDWLGDGPTRKRRTHTCNVCSLLQWVKARRRHSEAIASQSACQTVGRHTFIF